MFSTQFNTTDTNNSVASYGIVTTVTVLKSIPMILIGLASFAGNALVLGAVYRFKNLRTFSNLYIGSLAITDVVASLVMPLSYITVILDGRWVFGEALCNIQGYATTLLSSASMLTLLCFSIYRCYLVTTVRKRLSVATVGKAVKGSVGLIWVLACVYALPPLFGGGEVRYLPHYYSCLLDFSSSLYYTAFLVICVFSTPLIVMLVAYIKIIKFIRLHNQTITANTPPTAAGDQDKPPSDTNTPSCCPSEDADNRMTVMELRRKIDHIEEPTDINDDSSSDENETMKSKGRKGKNNIEESRENRQEAIEMTTTNNKAFALHSDKMSDNVTSYSPNEAAFVEQSPGASHGNSSIQERLKTISLNYVVDKWRSRTQNRRRMLRRYRKRVTHQARLARILLVTVVIFVGCWAPFAIDSMFRGFGHTEKRPKNFQLVSLWLAYTNALCNPIIYALLNTRFKKAFETILKELAGCVCICRR